MVSLGIPLDFMVPFSSASHVIATEMWTLMPWAIVTEQRASASSVFTILPVPTVTNVFQVSDNRDSASRAKSVPVIGDCAMKSVWIGFVLFVTLVIADELCIDSTKTNKF